MEASNELSTPGVSTGSSLHIFINNLDNAVEYALIKSAADTKLRGAADSPERRADIQRDPDRLERRAGHNLLRTNSPRHQDMLESSLAEKGPGVLVDTS